VPGTGMLPVHVDVVCGEADPHVAVTSLAHYLHLEVIEAAGGRDGVRGSDAARVLQVNFVHFIKQCLSSCGRYEVHSKSNRNIKIAVLNSF
jgi:hypothetical protein